MRDPEIKKEGPRIVFVRTCREILRPKTIMWEVYIHYYLFDYRLRASCMRTARVGHLAATGPTL